MTDSFCVYAYLRSRDGVNGCKGSPYYIGKGKKKRIKAAEHNVHVPPDPANIVVLAEGMNEADAFQVEMLLIHKYGRVDLGTGCLRNLTDGGEGNTRRVFSETSRKKISAIHKGRRDSAETIRRRIASLRETVSKRPVKEVCKRGHALTPDNIYVPLRSPNEKRCRICMKMSNAQSMAKRPSRVTRFISQNTIPTANLNCLY